jgi:drug/metabolite transporter (DMT)-like permease
VTTRSARIDLFGGLMVVLSALCYSSLGIFGKIALREGMPLTSLLATRFTLGAAILWGAVFASPLLRAALAQSRGRRAGLFLWGLAGFAGQSSLFFGALRFIPASLAEVLLYTCPAFLAIIVWARTGRRPGWPVVTAIALALAGTWLAAAPSGDAHQPVVGLVLAVVAGLWYACFLLALDRVTPGVPAVLSTAFVIRGAAVAFTLSVPLGGGYALPPTGAAWGAVMGLVAGPTVLGFALFVVGLRRVGPQTAAILSTFEPVGTIVLAMIVLGERLRPAQWVGAGLVLGAAFVLAASQGGTSTSAATPATDGAGSRPTALAHDAD